MFSRRVHQAAPKSPNPCTAHVHPNAGTSAGRGASAERKQAGIILALTAEPAPLPDFVGERLGAEPEESDVIHDLFAYLAERPSMNKEKNAEIKAFLDFPEGRISAPIEGLTNKTAIRYYWSPFQMNNNLLLQCLQRFL